MLPPSPSIFPVDEAAENSSNSDCEKCNNKFDQKLHTFRQQSSGGGGGSAQQGSQQRGQLTRQDAARPFADDADSFNGGDSGSLRDRFRRWLSRQRSRKRRSPWCGSGESSFGGVGGGSGPGGKSYEFLQEVAAALESAQHQQLHHPERRCRRQRGNQRKRPMPSAGGVPLIRTRSLRRALFACVVGGIAAFLLLGGCLIAAGHAWRHRPAITAGSILVISGGGLLLYSCCASSQYQSEDASRAGNLVTAAPLPASRWEKPIGASDSEGIHQLPLQLPPPPPFQQQPPSSAPPVPGRPPHLSMAVGGASSRQGSLYSLATNAGMGVGVGGSEMRLCRGNSITDMLHDTVPACLHRHQHQHHHHLQRHRSLASAIPLPL